MAHPRALCRDPTLVCHRHQVLRIGGEGTIRCGIRRIVRLGVIFHFGERALRECVVRIFRGNWPRLVRKVRCGFLVDADQRTPSIRQDRGLPGSEWPEGDLRWSMQLRGGDTRDRHAASREIGVDPGIKLVQIAERFAARRERVTIFVQ